MHQKFENAFKLRGFYCEPDYSTNHQLYYLAYHCIESDRFFPREIFGSKNKEKNLDYKRNL